MIYEVLSIPPNFATPPRRRVALNTDVLAGQAESIVAWPETRNEVVTLWQWAGRTIEEKTAFIGFWERMGGRAGIFLMPSWQRDFYLAALPESGDVNVSVLIPSYADTYLSTTYPDRPGRYIYFYCPKNGFHSSRVLTAEDSGSASVLTLECAMPWTPQPGTITGWMQAGRFENDEISFNHANEEAWSCEMPTRTIRIALDVTRDISMERRPRTLLWYHPQRVTQALAPASKIVHTYGFAIGPDALSTPQTDRFTASWGAWIGSDGVYLAKVSSIDPFTITDADGDKSLLFPTRPDAVHLSVAFDENGDEVIACGRRGERLISIHGKVGGVAKLFLFEGYSPQLFQFWTISNEAYDLPDANIVCIYIKKGTSGIYGRFESESFETEHLLGACPSVPIRIESIEISGVILQIKCIDDGQRVMTMYADYSYTTIPLYTHFINHLTHYHTTYYDGETVVYYSIGTMVGGVTYVETPVGTAGMGTMVYAGTAVSIMVSGSTYTLVTEPAIFATIEPGTIDNLTTSVLLNSTHAQT